MSGQNYYLLTALPSLGELGSTTPITASELIEHVSPVPSVLKLVEAVFLGGDLTQRQGYLSGELEKPYPVVLTVEQVKNEEPLPPELIIPQELTDPRSVVDAITAGYFNHALRVGQSVGSEFITHWVGFEVALRNALAQARAKSLSLDPENYIVAPELADRDTDFAAMIAEWSIAPNPLAGMRVLDGGRWDWLIEHEGWFSFDDDELACYAAKLTLIERWNRLERAKQTNIQTETN